MAAGLAKPAGAVVLTSGPLSGGEEFFERGPAGNRLITVPIFLAVLTGAGVIYAYLR